MTRALGITILVGIVAACGSLPNNGDGVVALQVSTPDSLFLYPNQSLTLQATALDIDGNPVTGTPITWGTTDTALITLDTLTGLITSRLDSAGFARVQARAGTLLSDPITITLRKDTTLTSLRSP